LGLDVLLLHMGEETLSEVLAAARHCRAQGWRTEVYPDAAKLKRQFKYADDRGVPHVMIIGSDEAAKGEATLRDMRTGDQSTGRVEDLVRDLRS
jgi:histidyl-tRNA synthetase